MQLPLPVYILTDKLHHTKGIVLRTVKYGDTSVIVSILTEKFGLQSYLVNGVRTTSKKGSSKASMFQPAALLDMVVYHSEFKQLHRIKEYKWQALYQHIYSDVPKNAVTLFMVELISKCLKQPETNEDLFAFCEDAFLHLDQASGPVMANFALFFALHLANFFGFRISDEEAEENSFLDLKEGVFVHDRPHHPHFLEEKQSEVTAHILKVMQPAELAAIQLNHDFRRQLLYAYENYYALHISDFGTLRTLPVLKAVLG